MSSDVYEKAQLLADAIAGSSELKELRETEKAMLADREAQDIIAEFQDSQQSLAELQREGKEITQVDRNKVAEIEQKVENNHLIAAYMEAQDRFTGMLDYVNSLLAQAIAGESGSDGATCGTDGCATCSGC
ncbi:YlbF family regulator [Paradesulfitobacterium ferrireducens]|uniref:YlbF family regulator n=1 Tax=Paradesulfitobacterium ferrireducens TaxID=2816476 RepID=UPI001A8F5B91|nr:YlbF family regulator [Paradesulfitobacterium ferrireducens]